MKIPDKRDCSPSVLIVSGRSDAEARRVAEALGELRVPTAFLDTVLFPGSARFSNREGRLFAGDAEQAAPETVYLRGLATHPLLPGYHEDLVERPRGLVAQCEEKRAFLESLLLTYERAGARLVNTLEANRQHSRKPWQLYLLERARLPIPRRVATNDPRAARAFVKENGPCVYKPLAGGATVRMVTKEDLSAARLASLALAPVLFQEYCEGMSVRAYVVGGRVVAAAEIRSDEVDYRRDEQEVVPTRLSPEERRAAAAAARACGMAFTGVDLLRGADGFRVLECNPSPMFAVFERKTGLDIAGPLARLLCRRGTRQSPANFSPVFRGDL